MRTAAIVTLSLLIAPALASAADVYRSIDAQGNIVYSDRPDENSVRVAIRNTAAATPTAAPRRASSAAQTSAAVPDQETIERAEREQLAEDRAANCEAARERNVTYSQSRRLYRVDADGERVYLSDAELSQARVDAEAEVARWCN